MITVACVRTGTKYGIEYVERLRNMVSRHLHKDYQMICLTDQPEQVDGVIMINISALGLFGWFGKMALFTPQIRGPFKTIYFDLDTIIIDDLKPLVEVSCTFGICENFTKLAGHPDWPCSYGSCVMVFAPCWGEHIFESFMCYQDEYEAMSPKGDQQAIEHLYPNATLLQNELPDGYMVGRRDFTDERPEGAAIMIFAGAHKPHNTPHKWLQEAWV